MKHFEKEILKHLKSHQSDLNQFILNHWKQHHYYATFSNYMDGVFIYKTGIIGINTLLDLSYKNKYYPSISFNNENIYNEPRGIKELSVEPLTKRQAEIKIADHLIKYYLPVLNLEKVKEILK